GRMQMPVAGIAAAAVMGMRESVVRLILRGAVLCAHGCAGPGGGDLVRVRWVNPADGAPRVEVSGLGANQRPESLLRVFAVTQPKGSDRDTPSMAGTYRIEGGVSVFEPQFPPDPGVT